MPPPPTTRPEHSRDASWGEPATRAALRQIADALRELARFQVCAVEVLRDGDQLEFVAIVGSPEGEKALLGKSSPVELMTSTFDLGAAYGTWIFLAEEWVTDEAREELDGYGWVPPIDDTDDPNRWRAHDMLYSKVLDERGGLRGIVYLDEPLSGKRPTPEELTRLAEDAQLLLRALLTQVEREELAQRARLARITRDLLLTSSDSHLGLADLMKESRRALGRGFRAQALAAYEYDEGPAETSESVVALPPDLHKAAAEATRQAWAGQQMILIERDGIWGDEALDANYHPAFHEHLVAHDTGSLALVPIGAGTDSIGMLVIARSRDGVRWTSPEIEAALEVGRDLGRMVLSHRTFEREQQLLAELQRLDDYRVELLSTVSHELKNPIGVLLGHLELLDGEVDLPVPVRSSLDAMGRSARRLHSLTENLLELRRESQPVNRMPVDLTRVVWDAVELSTVLAEQEGVTLHFDPASESVIVPGAEEELDRVVLNLVNNAVKYSRPGGRVELGLSRDDDEVVFTCRDHGIGISAEDQGLLFSEFFRSTNAEARAKPGTGLGLAIVKRIVERHEGWIDVQTELGTGTTFQVHLPL